MRSNQRKCPRKMWSIYRLFSLSKIVTILLLTIDGVKTSIKENNSWKRKPNNKNTRFLKEKPSMSIVEAITNSSSTNTRGAIQILCNTRKGLKFCFCCTSMVFRLWSRTPTNGNIMWYSKKEKKSTFLLEFCRCTSSGWPQSKKDIE